GVVVVHAEQELEPAGGNVCVEGRQSGKAAVVVGRALPDDAQAGRLGDSLRTQELPGPIPDGTGPPPPGRHRAPNPQLGIAGVAMLAKVCVDPEQPCAVHGYALGSEEVQRQDGRVARISTAEGESPVSYAAKTGYRTPPVCHDDRREAGVDVA